MNKKFLLKGMCDLLSLDVVCDVINHNVLWYTHKFKEGLGL